VEGILFVVVFVLLNLMLNT